MTEKEKKERRQELIFLLEIITQCNNEISKIIFDPMRQKTIKGAILRLADIIVEDSENLDKIIDRVENHYDPEIADLRRDLENL